MEKEEKEFRDTLNEKDIDISEKSAKSKKLITGIIILILVFIVTISLIILLVISSNSKYIGDISCVYNITNTNEKIKLLGSEFNKKTKFDMFIDDKKVDYAKEYTFDKIGEHKVKFSILEKINMDYMFKDIKDLNSVEMTSKESAEILSMISTFENCENLKNLTIDGFTMINIKSMDKIFYKSGLKEISLDIFDVSGISDM